MPRRSVTGTALAPGACPARHRGGAGPRLSVSGGRAVHFQIPRFRPGGPPGDAGNRPSAIRRSCGEPPRARRRAGLHRSCLRLPGADQAGGRGHAGHRRGWRGWHVPEPLRARRGVRPCGIPPAAAGVGRPVPGVRPDRHGDPHHRRDRCPFDRAGPDRCRGGGPGRCGGRGPGHRAVLHRAPGRGRRAPRPGGGRLAGAGGGGLLPGHRPGPHGPGAPPSLRQPGTDAARHRRRAVRRRHQGTGRGPGAGVRRPDLRPGGDPVREALRHRRHHPGGTGRHHPLGAPRRAGGPGRTGHGQDGRGAAPGRLPAVLPPVPPGGPGGAGGRAQPGVPLLHRAGPPVARRGRRADRHAGGPGAPRAGRWLRRRGRRPGQG